MNIKLSDTAEKVPANTIPDSSAFTVHTRLTGGPTPSGPMPISGVEKSSGSSAGLGHRSTCIFVKGGAIMDHEGGSTA